MMDDVQNFNLIKVVEGEEQVVHSPVLPKGFTISPTLHQQGFDQLGEQQHSASGCYRTGSGNSYTGLGISWFCFSFLFFRFLIVWLFVLVPSFLGKNNFKAYR